MNPPQMVRMGDGRMVPAQTDFGKGPPENQKFLIVIQYYDGDVAEAEDLANIIADLERVRNKDADVMLFGRHDAQPFPSHVRSKLESKFDKVHQVTCRNRDGTTYPFASNGMFYDLVTLLGQYHEWNKPYYAFINLESDCVPLHPGWIRELINEFKVANAYGKGAIGHFHQPRITVGGGIDAPVHMNGVGVYAIDMFYRVPGGKLQGGRPNVAYDIEHKDNITPIAQDTPFIAMEYRRPTITAADLFRAHKGAVEPAIFHGVKDSSAREAVKARHITFSQSADLSRKTVFTYQHTSTDVGHGQINELFDLWRQGWLSRGWNPVVLRLMDAARNPRFQEISSAIDRLPYAGDRAEQKAEFYRWLALDTVGGGLMVNPDQHPNNFTPFLLKENMQVWRPQLKEFFDRVSVYAPKPTDLKGVFPHVSDEMIGEFKGSLMEWISVADVGAMGFKTANMVDFSDRALNDSQWRGQRKGDVIREYLRGVL